MVPLLVAKRALYPIFSIQQIFDAFVVLRVHLATVVTKAVFVVEIEATRTKAELALVALICFELLSRLLAQLIRANRQLSNLGVYLNWDRHGLGGFLSDVVVYWV